MTSPTAPTREIGYAQTPVMSTSGASSAQWWMYEDETTPELRWPQSVFVYDQMRRQDSQVVSVLRAVTLPVRRTPWRIDPAGARDEVVQLVAEDLGLPIVGREMVPLPRTRDRFSWTDHLREALLMLPFGHSYFEQLYRIVNGQARLRKLGVRMPKTIEQIDVARDGGLISITQYGLGGGVSETPIPVSRLVAYIHEGESGNWLGTSLLRPAYKNWLLKDRLLRVQAQTIERNGMGIPVYTAAPSEKNTDNGLKLATSLRSGESAGAALPAEATLRLMGVEGQLPDAEPAIRYHDEQIGRAVLAHFLNLGTQTGSWALGSTFADFFTLSLQTLAQQIADVASQHIVEDLVDLNFGEDEPAPKIVFDEIGSRQAATAEAIRALIDAGVITPDEVLEGAVRQQFGLPPKAPGTEPAEAQEDFSGESDVFASAGPNVDSDVDDEPIGELDDDTLILLQAMYELELEQGLVLAAWNPDLHRRWPKGHPKAGKFKPMVDLLKEAIRKHDGEGHPFDNFKRPQLLKAAKVRGITLKKGESEDSIKAKLLADLGGKPVAAPDKKAAESSIPGVELQRITQIFGEAPDAYRVDFNGQNVGTIHGNEADADGQWTPFRPTNASWTLKNPGAKRSKDDAVKELVDSFEAGQAKSAPKATDAKPQDNLDQLNAEDLHDLAVEYGVETSGRKREDIIADLRLEIAAQKKAATKAPKATPPKSTKDDVSPLTGKPVSESAWAKKAADDSGGSTPAQSVTTEPFSGGAFAGKKASLKVNVDGEHVGAVHQEADGHWTATPPAKNAPYWTPEPPVATKDQAIKSLVDADLKQKAGTAPTASVNKANQKQKTDPTILAGDFSSLKQVGAQDGTTPGGVFEAPDGSRWYVKAQKSPQHAQNEALASAFYRAAGIDTPGVFVGKGTPGLPDGSHTAMRMVDGAQANLADKLDDDAYINDIRKGFAVDAWLANWDVVGEGSEHPWGNIVEGADGKPHRIDVGGALLFRGTGGEKGDKFGPQVVEFDTMRKAAKGRRHALIFADMSGTQLANSVGLVKGITPAKIRKLVADHGMDPDLADTLIARRKDLISRVSATKNVSKGWKGAAIGEAALDSAPVKITSSKSATRGLLEKFGLEPDAAHWAVNGFEEYQDGKYGDMNRALLDAAGGDLRAGSYQGMHDEDITMVESMDKAMKASKLTKDVVVFRGERAPARSFPPGTWSLTGGMEGMEWTWHPFGSSSTDSDVAESFATGATSAPKEQAQPTVFRILVPKGTPAVHLQGDLPSEQELLLGRSLKYRVVKDYGVEDGLIRRIDVEVLPA